MTADQLIQQAAIQIPEEDLRDIVRRIVEVADPEKIIVFGSAARGSMGPNSDLDLLVIKRGDYHHVTAEQELYRALRGIGYAKDIILVTPEEVAEYGDCFALVIYPALREGKVIYERPAAQAF
jgi:predicted nucleotidyltransferase